jgi:hypothetical protein
VASDGVCSCSLMEDRYHHYAAFENYCPACGSYGSLDFEDGPVRYTCPEGMWYCTVCDADYCLVHGKEHRAGTVWYLNPYQVPGDEFHTGTEVKVNAKNDVELIKEKWVENKDRVFMEI